MNKISFGPTYEKVLNSHKINRDLRNSALKAKNKIHTAKAEMAITMLAKLGGN